MLHHVDVHVRDLQPIRILFDSIAETLGYRLLHSGEQRLSYEPVDSGRPRLGFIQGASQGSGSMRLAFSVDSRERVDQAASLLRSQGAKDLEGPGLHPEYGDEYYAVFFSDVDANRYEILAAPRVQNEPKVARLWRSRVKPGLLRSYRRYIRSTGIVDYRNTPGNCGAWILSSSHADHDDVMTLSFWDSKSSIAAFAGDHIERAQYYPEDDHYLLEMPERVEHYEID